MKLTYLSCLAVCALLLSSCSKDNDNNKPDPVEEEKPLTCQLTKNLVYENGAATDSFVYVYNAAGKVEQVDAGAYSYELVYGGDKVVERKYNGKESGSLFATEKVYYNTNGTIEKIERFDASSSLTQTVLFTYQNNKLTEVTFRDQADVERAKYTYTYTINNITRLDAAESWNDVPRNYRFDLTYDTAPNQLRGGQQALLIDGFLGSHIGMAVLYIVSDNLVKTITDGATQMPVQYEIDKQKNVTGINVAGQPVMKAAYTCK